MPVVQKPDVPQKMHFDDFILWAELQEGRWELHDGVPVRLHDPLTGQSERARHVRAKGEIFIALRNAVKKYEKSCEVMGDDELVVPDPLIIVEVLSPSTAYKDVGDKLADYFKLPSVAHYLIIDPKNSRIMHHFRDGGEIKAKAVNSADLHLEPPGLALELGELFG